MQADEPAFEKVFCFQTGTPSVVIGITDNESRQNEKEIDGQVSVIESLVDGACCKTFENMIQNNHEGRHTAQSVEDFVMGFSI